MSIEEQADLGRMLLKKRELERELKCWRDKALKMGRNLAAVGTALRNLGHENVPIEISDDLLKSVAAYPTKEEVETALRETKRLSDEVKRLEELLN